MLGVGSADVVEVDVVEVDVVEVDVVEVDVVEVDVVEVDWVVVKAVVVVEFISLLLVFILQAAVRFWRVVRSEPSTSRVVAAMLKEESNERTRIANRILARRWNIKQKCSKPQSTFVLFEIFSSVNLNKNAQVVRSDGIYEIGR